MIAKFTWDEARRLTKVTDPTGDVMAYGYDVMGNVTSTSSKTSGGTTVFSESAQFDVLGRLLKDIGGAAAQTWVYAHDKEDNLTTTTDAQSLVTTLRLLDG